jgi:hypothetical protein
MFKNDFLDMDPRELRLLANHQMAPKVTPLPVELKLTTNKNINIDALFYSAKSRN